MAGTLNDAYKDADRLRKEGKSEAQIENHIQTKYPIDVVRAYLADAAKSFENKKNIEAADRRDRSIADSQRGKSQADRAYSVALVKMKAAADGKRYGYSNPPFDPRIDSWLRFGPEGAGNLQRGFLVQDKEYWQGTGQKKGYSCNFLYNPSVISVTYETNMNVLPSDAQTEGQNAAQALISSMQSIEFALLFDRTYEVATLNRGPKGTRERELLGQGVYADIAALERVVGIYRTDESTLGGQGPMLRIPTSLVFGKLNFAAKPLSWYGFVSGMSVSYTHFGSNMTPVRATVSLNFSQLVKISGKLVDPKDGTEAPAGDQTAVG